MSKKAITLSILMITLILFCFSYSSRAEEYEVVGQNSVGETVQRLQTRLRELDYLYFKPTGSYKGMTVKAVIKYQQTEGMPADGTSGDETQKSLFSARAMRSPIALGVSIPIGPSLKGTPKITGSLTEWETVKTSLVLNQSYKITDYNTGNVFYMTFTGGDNHAEMECVTPEDTAMFLSIFGGSYNYSKRPVVIGISGQDVAASLYGFPHGTKEKSGDFPGHTCLFFQGSSSHVAGIGDVEHQRQIYVAAGQ